MKERQRKEKRKERKEKTVERNERSKKKQKKQETTNVEVSELPKRPTKALFTEVVSTEVPPTNILEDETEVEIEHVKALKGRKRKGKMIISDSESTETEGYAKEQGAFIPLLSMVAKNVVADKKPGMRHLRVHNMIRTLVGNLKKKKNVGECPITLNLMQPILLVALFYKELLLTKVCTHLTLSHLSI